MRNFNVDTAVGSTGADIKLTHVQQITHLNPQIEERALGMARNVSWQTHDGTILDGTVVLPANYRPGRRYPTIVWVYAGEREGSRNGNMFGGRDTNVPYLNLQLFASRGYAVFVPNSVLRVGSPMRDIADNILPGVDKIAAMGIADPARLGVYGQSYGGYSVLSLVIQTNRFKAAVSTAGFSDLVSMYATLYPDGTDWTGFAESEQGRMGGTPWQYRDRYIENSPFFYLDRVQTPILLEYGSEDIAAAINLGETFVGLRRLGKKATLVGYAGEDHVLNKTSNQIDFANRVLEWFSEYLR